MLLGLKLDKCKGSSPSLKVLKVGSLSWTDEQWDTGIKTCHACKAQRS